MKTTVLLPGTYDPATRGHFAVIETAAALFDEVRAVIFINPDKTCLFPVSDRLNFLRLATANFPNVTVGFSEGLVADYVRDNGIDLIVKGVRDGHDFLYEREMADWNGARGAKTLLLPTAPDLSAVSSTALRDRLQAGQPIDGLAAPGTTDAILAAYRRLSLDKRD